MTRVVRMLSFAGTCAFVLAAASPRSTAQSLTDDSTLQITSPRADAVVLGPARLEAVLSSRTPADRVSFFVDGRMICAPEQPPYGCAWDAGGAARGHHVRVVAYLQDGQRVVANLRTKELGYTERVDVDAVQVPVVVTNGGRFVRGLTRNDFALAQDGVPQRIASVVSEDMPLDLVLAIDISGSMDAAMSDVKRAVKQFLTKLRPGDAVTLLGFNETTFKVAEQETDARARVDAVDLLAAWGGTALYDATIKALDLVRPQRGRKGVVIFSDGDDRHSVSRRETAMARVQGSDAMLFTVAFGRGGSLPELRRSLESYARASGGRAFFARDTAELDRAFSEIVEELANQYVLSYAPPDLKRDGSWHTLQVKIRNGKYHVRAREGYRAAATARARSER